MNPVTLQQLTHERLKLKLAGLEKWSTPDLLWWCVRLGGCTSDNADVANELGLTFTPAQLWSNEVFARPPPSLSADDPARDREDADGLFFAGQDDVPAAVCDTVRHVTGTSDSKISEIRLYGMDSPEKSSEFFAPEFADDDSHHPRSMISSTPIGFPEIVNLVDLAVANVKVRGSRNAVTVGVELKRLVLEHSKLLHLRPMGFDARSRAVYQVIATRETQSWDGGMSLSTLQLEAGLAVPSLMSEEHCSRIWRLPGGSAKYYRRCPAYHPHPAEREGANAMLHEHVNMRLIGLYPRWWRHLRRDKDRLDQFLKGVQHFRNSSDNASKRCFFHKALKDGDQQWCTFRPRDMTAAFSHLCPDRQKPHMDLWQMARDLGRDDAELDRKKDNYEEATEEYLGPPKSGEDGYDAELASSIGGYDTPEYAINCHLSGPDAWWPLLGVFANRRMFMAKSVLGYRRSSRSGPHEDEDDARKAQEETEEAKKVEAEDAAKLAAAERERKEEEERAKRRARRAVLRGTDRKAQKEADKQAEADDAAKLAAERARHKTKDEQKRLREEKEAKMNQQRHWPRRWHGGHGF